MKIKSDKMRVLIGMSGGMDSTLAAFLLKEKGYSVIAATMSIWNPDMKAGDKRRKGCFGPGEEEEIERVKRIAEKLGIKHVVVRLAGDYSREVIGYFRREYLLGRTPNPCVICNRKIKFASLVENAKKMGIEFDLFATGHYARVLFNESTGRYELLKGVDVKKDQSYFLAFLTQEQLRQTIFPLGEKTKDEVRTEIVSLGLLPLVGQKESQDFIESGDYGMLFSEGEIRPGPILLADGRKIGRHKGLIYYTVGQRKGLGLGGQSEPLYVTALDPERNAVIVGKEEELYSSVLVAGHFNWVSIKGIESGMRVKAKIRQKHEDAPAMAYPLEGGERVRVVFDRPQRSITPGQIAVLYGENDKVLGGGIIENFIVKEVKN